LVYDKAANHPYKRLILRCSHLSTLYGDNPIKTNSDTVVLRTFHNDAKEILTYKSGNENIYCLKATTPPNLLNSGVYYLNLFAGIHRIKWLIKKHPHSIN